MEINTPVRHEEWGCGVVRVVRTSNGEVTKVRVVFGDKSVNIPPDELEALD